MLAQNFKAAADLGISDIEFRSLVEVLGMIEREEIPAAQFHMGEIGRPECGTAGCILGWTRVANMDTFFSLARKACLKPVNRHLQALFYTGSAFSASRSQAAAALRSYLTTGHPRWDEALA